MNARTIRRALERKARKEQDREARQEALESAATNAAAAQAPISEARLVANRHNAQLSTGPKTAAGKSVSSRNAVRTALTGRTVLLPTDDADRYQAHCRAFFKELAPESHRETVLAQSLADNAWRIERIASFEMAIFAKGRSQFADAYPNEPAAIRAALIEHDIYQANERELRNLHLQEARLRRQRDKDLEELRRLQAERKAAAQARAALASAASARKVAAGASTPPEPETEIGFVFSNTEFDGVTRDQARGMADSPRKNAA